MEGEAAALARVLREFGALATNVAAALAELGAGSSPGFEHAAKTRALIRGNVALELERMAEVFERAPAPPELLARAETLRRAATLIRTGAWPEELSADPLSGDSTTR